MSGIAYQITSDQLQVTIEVACRTDRTQVTATPLRGWTNGLACHALGEGYVKVLTCTEPDDNNRRLAPHTGRT